MENEKVMLVLNQYDEVMFEVPIDKDGKFKFASMSQTLITDLLNSKGEDYDMLKFVVEDN